MQPLAASAGHCWLVLQPLSAFQNSVKCAPSLSALCVRVFYPDATVFLPNIPDAIKSHALCRTPLSRARHAENVFAHSAGVVVMQAVLQNPLKCGFPQLGGV